MTGLPPKSTHVNTSADPELIIFLDAQVQSIHPSVYIPTVRLFSPNHVARTSVSNLSAVRASF